MTNKCSVPKQIVVSMLPPPQRPPTVALGRNARRLGRGKNLSVPRAPAFSLQRSRSRIFLSLVFTNGASAEERGVDVQQTSALRLLL